MDKPFNMSFTALFTESKGQPIIYKGKELKMMDRVSLPSGNVSFKLRFVSSDSDYKQGIILETKGDFYINEQKIPKKIVLWEDTAPKEVLMQVKSKNKEVLIYNAWRLPNGTIHYWYNGGALYTENQDGKIIYHCNDGFPDEDFNDLIFSVEII